jgi:hypothetical protein
MATQIIWCPADLLQELRVSFGLRRTSPDQLPITLAPMTSGEDCRSLLVGVDDVWLTWDRFGHTFRGSFGFTIESPVSLNDEPPVIGSVASPPFTCRVVERIARGLQAVDYASTSEDPSAISNHYSTGMSANMCESLVSLIHETGVASQEISIKFSTEWAPSEGLVSESRLPVMLQHVAVLKEAAIELRKKEDNTPTLVVGRVVALETEGNPNLLEDTSAREVVISWETPSPIRVHVFLAPPDYLTALEPTRQVHGLASEAFSSAQRGDAR